MLRITVVIVLWLLVGAQAFVVLQVVNSTAHAGLIGPQLANSTLPAGGFLLDGSSAFLRDDVNGKLLTR
jgi:hypothetical protein